MAIGILVFCVLAGILLAVGITKSIQQREMARTAQFSDLAEEMGLQFHPECDSAVMESVAHLRLFNQGHGRKSKNMVYGQTDEVDLAVFGYRFTTGGGQHQQTHQQSVICFRSPEMNLPDFELRPEHLFHRIGEALGYQDIDFDSHPIFSKKFLLRGSNESAVREFFTPERLTFLEALDGISIEASGDRLIYYRANLRIKPEDLRSFMEEGFRVFNQFTQS